MRIYVAGISGELQHVKSLRTFYEIEIESGDEKRERASGRGDIARQLACEEFLERKEFDAISMFDLDMLHEPDVLKKLRSHNLDMVTGHYYARNARNIHSIISNIGAGTFPFPPLVNVERCGLHPKAITGMGCVLIKRKVVEAVANYLPKGDNPFAIGIAPEITGDHRSLGIDFRFFSLARKLGYQLWLDASIESRHGVILWINHELADKLRDYPKQAERLGAIEEQIRKDRGMNKSALETRIKKIEANLNDLREQRDRAAKTLDFLSRQIIAYEAVLNDENFLLAQGKDGENPTFPAADAEEKQMMIQHRKELPDISEAEAKDARSYAIDREAKEFVDDIQVIKRAE